MFDIKVKGLDEVIEQLDDMIHGLSEEGLNEYCDRAKAIAHRDCGLTNDAITFQAKKADNEDKIAIEFSLKDRNKLPCVKKAIERVLLSIPITAKPLFEQLIKQMEKEESEKIDQ